MASSWLMQKKKLLQEQGRSKFDMISVKKCITCLSDESSDIVFAALDIVHFMLKTRTQCNPWDNWDDHVNFEYFVQFQDALDHIHSIMCKYDDIPNAIKQQIDDIMNCASYYYHRSGHSAQQHQHHRTLIKIWTKLSMDYKSMVDKEIDIRSDSLERHIGTVLFGADSCYLPSIHRSCLYDTIATSSYSHKNKICTAYFRLYLNINPIQFRDIIAAISPFYFVCNDTIKKLVNLYQSVNVIRDTSVRKMVCHRFNGLLRDECSEGKCDIAMDLMHHSVFNMFLSELKGINNDEIEEEDERFGYYNRYHLIHDGQSELETICWIIRRSQFISEFIDSGLLTIIMQIIKPGIHGDFSDKAFNCLATLLYFASKQHLFKFINVQFIRSVLNALMSFDESWDTGNGMEYVYSSTDSFVMKGLHRILMNHRIIRIFEKCKALKWIKKIKCREHEMEKHCDGIVDVIKNWRSCGNSKCQWTRKRAKKRDGRRFKICSQCQNISYCSRKCQKIDWKHQHQAICVAWN